MTLNALLPRPVRGTAIACFVLSCLCTVRTLPGADTSRGDLNEQVKQRESTGDLAGAKSLLQQALQSQGNSAAAQDLAEFLDRHHDPGCREAYLQWASVETDPAKRQLALRQAVLIDFMNGQTAQLESDLSSYRAAGGTDLSSPSSAGSRKPSNYSMVLIPGPLRSFARMAALTPDLAPEDLLPALARNVVTNGYEASGNELLQQTEYLRLLVRYIGQARELQAMANRDRKIVIPTCDSDEAGNLLKILGYRMRGSCGADIVLETVNPTRAFLTVDSGFPLTQLEQDLRANHKFELSYAPTPIPVLYSADYWMAALGRQSDFIDGFLSDPSLCRLYLGLSHLDHATAEALRRQAAPGRLKIYAHVLDFFGGMFQIRNGAAVVPGSPKVWASMVGVSPNNPGAFFEKLLETDDGWMASYFDALSRISGPTADYLTQSDHIKRFYDALRGKITSPGPARPVFRSSTELMLLTTSLRIGPDGEPLIPGNLDVWRSLFVKHPHGKYDGRLTRSAANWRSKEDLIDALFGLSRKTVENEPLQMFLALSDIDRDRSKPISPELASRLISHYRNFGSQYAIFADSPNLTEPSMNRFLDVITATAAMHPGLLQADSLGTVQSLVELWRILCRQDSIPAGAQDATFQKLIDPFTHIKQEADVFNAGKSGVDVLLAAVDSNGPASRQERIVELLVGSIHSRNAALRSPAENFLRIFDSQRLISIDSLVVLANGGPKPAEAKAMTNLRDQLSRVEEAESMHGSLSGDEKSSYNVGYWSSRHIDQELKLNVDAIGKNGDKDVRGQLAPLMRDSLVGLLYSYYAPAGSQLLMANPLFVRSHDFVGAESSPAEWRPTAVAATGWPASAGGRLTGSLVSLPYAIAESEQNFLTPRQEQALIWSDLVPQMIVDVTVTRWRNVTPDQTRWVSLHMERGRALLAAAALDPKLEPRVIDSLLRYTNPGGIDWIREHLHSGDFAATVARIPPSVLYALAVDPALKGASPDVASLEIASMAEKNDPDLTPAAIARAFGTPKPTLTHSYRPGLLYLRTFPALMGYSSRILAESWESNNLYYAALADEAGVPASQLDVYVPEWNRTAIEGIFATHLEDWPALLRSLQTLTANVRQHNNAQLTATSEN